MNADIAVGTGMKITCSRDELAAKLGVVSRGLSTRGTVQILAGVLLQVQDGSLELAATDMELSLRTKLEANVEGEGSAVVPGRLLTDIVRLLPEEEVVLEHRVDESTVYVSSGSSESRLRTYAVEDFPSPARHGPRGALHARGGTAARDDRAGQPRRQPRRVAACADGHPRSLRGVESDHGCDRLIPHGREGDGRERRRAGA